MRRGAGRGAHALVSIGSHTDAETRATHQKAAVDLAPAEPPAALDAPGGVRVWREGDELRIGRAMPTIAPAVLIE